MRVAGACLLVILLTTSALAQDFGAVEGPGVEPPLAEAPLALAPEALALAPAAVEALVASTSIESIDVNAQEAPPDLNVAVSFEALQAALTDAVETGTNISGSFSDFAQAVLVPAAANLTDGASQALQQPAALDDVVVHVLASPAQVLELTGTTADDWVIDVEPLPASAPTAAGAAGRRRLAAAGRRAKLQEEGGESGGEGDEEPELYPVVEKIGFGYDLAGGKYADIFSTKVTLFKDGWLGNQVIWKIRGTDERYLAYEGLNPIWGNAVYDRATEGDSASQYKRTLNVNAGLAGSYQGFEASLDLAFGAEQAGSNEAFYSTRGITRQASKLGLKSNIKQLDYLRRNLDPQFKKDLDNPNFSSDDLFAAYGTHWLASGVVGGRYDYSRKAQKSAFSDFKSFQVAMSVSVTTVTAGATLKAGSDGAKSVEKLESASTATTITVGGEQGIVTTGDAGSEDSEDKYKEWIKTVSGQLMTLVEFQRDSLQPIWQLASKDDRRTKLQAATDVYMTTVDTRPGSSGPTAADREDQCGQILDKYSDFVPGTTYGSMNQEDRNLWDSELGCEAPINSKPMCGYIRKKYKVQAGVTWGNLPPRLWSSYRIVACWEVSPDVNVAGSVSFCAKIAMTTSGFRPKLDWGMISPADKIAWSGNYPTSCDQQMCYFWKQAFVVSPCSDWGVLPTYWRESWDRQKCNGADFTIKTKLRYPTDKC